jgi:hypothetical protein
MTITAESLVAALDTCPHVRRHFAVAGGLHGFHCTNWAFTSQRSDEFASQTFTILTGQIVRECQELNHTLTILKDRCRIKVHDPEGIKKSIEHAANGPFAVLLAFEHALRRGNP